MTCSRTVSPGTRSRVGGQELVVLRDEVDLAGSPARTGHDRWGRDGRADLARGRGRGGDKGEQRDREHVTADAPAERRGDTIVGVYGAATATTDVIP